MTFTDAVEDVKSRLNGRVDRWDVQAEIEASGYEPGDEIPDEMIDEITREMKAELVDFDTICQKIGARI